MRLLVIGASGFIGSRLFDLGNRLGHEMRGTQLRPRHPLLTSFDMSRQSILEVVDRPFFQADPPCFVVHAAGFGGPDACVREIENSRRANINGMARLVTDLQPFPVRHVYLSSSYVFDGREGGYQEGDVCSPICEYGRQKLEAEDLLNSVMPKPLVLRIDKVVSDAAEPGHLFAEWRARWGAGQAVRCLRGQTMSPVHVDDVASGILEACRLDLSGLFHVAGRSAKGRSELAQQLRAALGGSGDIQECDWQELSLSEPRPLRCHLDGSRFQAATGFQPAPAERICANFARHFADPEENGG